MGNTEKNIDEATLIQSVALQSYTLRSLEEGTEYPVRGKEVLIGREVECQVPLRAGHVSRYHAKITLTTHAAYIEDLQSTNGTFINGKRVVGRQQISIGDDIRFHDQHFRLVSSESGDADATLITSFNDGDSTQPRIQPPQAETIEAPAPSSPGFSPPFSPPPKKVHQAPAHEQEKDEQTSLLSMHELHALDGRSSKSQKAIRVGNGPRLVILTAPIRGKVFPLKHDAPIGRQWDIGRDGSAAIAIGDKTVSQNHAKIINTQNGWLIATTSAKNGVMVNGLSITRAFLSHNDRIRLGRIELAFMTDEGEPPAESIYDLPMETGYNKGLIATLGISALVVLTLVIALAIR